MFSIMMRTRPMSSVWAPADGLSDCPEDFRPAAEVVVATVNGQAGWARYMIVDRVFDARRPPCDDVS